MLDLMDIDSENFSNFGENDNISSVVVEKKADTEDESLARAKMEIFRSEQQII